MGERGPIGDPHGRRAQDRYKNVRLLPPPAVAEGKKETRRPPCPKVLVGQARRHWRYLVKCLEEKGRLEHGHLATIMSAAIAFGEAHELQEAGNQIREKMKKAPGDPELGRALASLNRSQRQTLKNLVEFEGKLLLNPNAEARKGKPVHQPVPMTKRERLLS